MQEPSIQDRLRLILAQANGCAYEQQENAEHAADGQFSNRLGIAALRALDRDPVLLRRPNIDAVQPHAVHLDEPAALCPADDFARTVLLSHDDGIELFRMVKIVDERNRATAESQIWS